MFDEPTHIEPISDLHSTDPHPKNRTDLNTHRLCSQRASAVSQPLPSHTRTQINWLATDALHCLLQTQLLSNVTWCSTWILSEPDDDCVNIKSAALSVDQRVYLSTNEDGDSGHVGTCCSSVVKLQAKVDGQKSECMAMPHHVSDVRGFDIDSPTLSILRSRSDLSYSDKRFYCIEVRPLAATRSVNAPHFQVI